MNTSCNALPGIISVACLSNENVQPHSDLKCLAGVPIEVFTEPLNVPLHGAATCETVSSRSKNGRSETTTLRFKSLSTLPVDRRLAFIITVASRQRYLVGLHEPPYPIIKCTRTTGTPGGDAAVMAYEVTFTALKSLVPLG